MHASIFFLSSSFPPRNVNLNGLPSLPPSNRPGEHYFSPFFIFLYEGKRLEEKKGGVAVEKMWEYHVNQLYNYCFGVEIFFSHLFVHFHVEAVRHLVVLEKYIYCYHSVIWEIQGCALFIFFILPYCCKHAKDKRHKKVTCRHSPFPGRKEAESQEREKNFFACRSDSEIYGKVGKEWKVFSFPPFSLEAIFVPSGFLYVGKGKETASLYLKGGGKNSRFGIALQIRCEKK